LVLVLLKDNSVRFLPPAPARLPRLPSDLRTLLRDELHHASLREVSVRPRKGSAAICSRCHQPARGYGQLTERRFEFIPLWGFFVFLLYVMRRVECRRCGSVIVERSSLGRWQAHAEV